MELILPSETSFWRTFPFGIFGEYIGIKTTVTVMGLWLCLMAAFFFFCCFSTTQSALGLNGFLSAEVLGKYLVKTFDSASLGFLIFEITFCSAFNDGNLP